MASTEGSTAIRIIEPVKPDVASPDVADEKSHAVSQDAVSLYGSEASPHDLEHGSRKQTFGGLMLLWLSFQSCGIIYGDIGTSPLYVYSSTFTSQPSWDDLVGALSIIIWSLTLIVSVKYVCIVLLADDDGQGGTFALYSLLARYARINKTSSYSANKDGFPMQRYLTGDMTPTSRSVRRFIENSPLSQTLVKLVGILGVSMVMADGVLTPAQSVLGAIQGITVVRPDLGTSAIVGISCAILVFLFLLQPFGTARLGTAFAPIVVVWLLFNLACGIYNLVVFDHTVLKAFSPHYAIMYLVRNGHDGWRSLGGLLLAFTGVEALFADLAAFGKRAIQLSWLCLAYPCLLLAYIGQAANIAQDATGTNYTNPFYKTVPPGTFYFSMVIAILAAIVASQAMVTSTFQLLVQVMRLSYFPHIKVVHTSDRFHEQVYVPMANWLLMIGSVIVTAVYNNTTSLGNAYGVCVIVVTFLTTCMLCLVALVIWRLPVYVVLPIFTVFALMDGTFMSAALTKVPDGAWFTLLLAFLLSSIFVLWRYGKEAQWTAEEAKHVPLETSMGMLSTPVSTVPGIGIFFDKLGDPVRPPPCFTQFLLKFAARPAVLVFFHMRPLDVPTVLAEDRYTVTRRRQRSGRTSAKKAADGVDATGAAALLLPNCYTVILRHGYAEDPLHPGIANDLIAQVDKYLGEKIASAASSARTSSSAAPSTSSSSLAASAVAELQSGRVSLRTASQSQIVYLLGKEAMRVNYMSPLGKPGCSAWVLVRGFVRRMLLETFLWIRENSRTKLADFAIDIDKTIEVGYLTDL
ncbi:potassium transporter [Ophiostoma piceae UAMH 11346]|uniref:Potassium transporter n=1 Tax=Ophiostoma piceae (strain UAMH 11346) TaxID=1262450 RepID=S3CG37_OPHP1|nr:potassium transporter [Ophiostoma piceae UAMH 11346]